MSGVICRSAALSDLPAPTGNLQNPSFVTTAAQPRRIAPHLSREVWLLTLRCRFG
jgi:hypothetical protein